MLGGPLARALGLAVGLIVGACFSESGPPPCPVGTMGCSCNAGACDTDLECAGNYCVLADCMPGSEFCECADGGCDAGLECVDGAICLSPSFGSGDGGNGGDDAADDGVDDGADDAPPSTSGMTTPADDGTNESGPPDDGMEATDAGTVGAECDTACGACSACVDGSCTPTPGVTCEGPTLQCADYTFGMDDGVCRQLAEALLEPTCNDAGECIAPSFESCPMLSGTVLYSCSPTCVTNSSGCSPGLPASEVDLGDICQLDGPTLGCDTMCNPSNEFELLIQICEMGQCTDLGPTSCNGHICSGSFCANGCDEVFFVCEPGYVCTNNDCVN